MRLPTESHYGGSAEVCNWPVFIVTTGDKRLNSIPLSWAGSTPPWRLIISP